MRMMYYSVNNTGIFEKKKTECSYQFGRSTTELQETRGIFFPSMPVYVFSVFIL